MKGFVKTRNKQRLKTILSNAFNLSFNVTYIALVNINIVGLILIETEFIDRIPGIDVMKNKRNLLH